MEIDFESINMKRLEKLGDCAVSAHIDFSRGTDTKCVLKDDEVIVYELTDPEYIARITDMLCVERSIMIKLLELQIAELNTDYMEKIRIYEKYEEYDRIALNVAEIRNFNFRSLKDKTLMSCKLRDKTGKTPLMYMCEEAYVDGALALLATDFAQIGQVSQTGYTALIYACMLPYSMKLVIEKLIDSGESKPGQICKGGSTALMELCKSHSDIGKVVCIVKKLLETGEAKPGHIAHDGTTPLIQACASCSEKIATLLLETGKSKYKHRTPSGETAFTYTVRFKRRIPLFYKYFTTYRHQQKELIVPAATV